MKEKWRERKGRNDMDIHGLDICAAHFSNADFFFAGIENYWKLDQLGAGKRTRNHVAIG